MNPDNSHPILGSSAQGTPATDSISGSRRLFFRRAIRLLAAAPFVAPVVGAPGGLIPRLLADESAGSSELTHVVVRGDSLSRIAAKYKTTVTTLRKINGIQGDLLRPGQVLKVGTTFEVEFPCLTCCEKGLTSPRIQTKRWQKVILHHSATPSGNALSFEQYHRKIRGMENGLAYHFVVGNGNGSPDGHIEVGERWSQQLQGGHVKSFSLNEVSIGICLVGNFEKTRPTTKQLEAAEELVKYLTQRALPGRVEVHVHRDLESTLCPGRFFPSERFTRSKA